jgi:hypothetical protein
VKRLRLGPLLLGAALFSGACGATPGSTAGPSQFVDVPGLGSTRIDVPRPTTEASACTVALPHAQSIGERVVALRAIGLFADRPDVSNEDIVGRVEAQLDEMYGVNAISDDPFGELVVAARDESRVWWGDLEADVDQSNQVYAQTLGEWAAISKGAFKPEDIQEMWDAARGPVTVTLTHAGQTVVLEPEYLEDWIDPRILTPINELIANSGRKFELFQAFDQTAFVMALKEDEREALEARGWCFD